MNHYDLPLRLRRLRKSDSVRSLLQETCLQTSQFIVPLFIYANLKEKTEISSMPGQFQLPLASLEKEIAELSELGIKAVLLFGIPEYKDAIGSSALSDDGIIQEAIPIIKRANPNLLIITDLCFCEYTDHGHCGIFHDNQLDNDLTLSYLAKQAVSHAKAGADWVAPSSNTDGMVKAIRQELDSNGCFSTAILSYAVKYSSSFYGPFREAALGAPKFGDRKSYQMNPANAKEALREARLDINEGADLIMVKPAMNYLDIIYQLKQEFAEVPLCAYQVSGEYSMIKFAASNGLINEEQAMLESLFAIKRAGADLIISYFAKDLAKLARKAGSYGLTFK